MSLRNAVTFSGKSVSGLCAQPVDPELQRIARRSEQPFPFVRLQLVRERDRRQLRRVQNLIRIRVANAADQARIGKSPLERAVFGRERGAKRVEIAR